MDAAIVTLTAAEAEAAYHAGLIAAVDGLPFAAPDGPALAPYQHGWDDGLAARLAWADAVD